MSKRLQVLLEEAEFQEIRALARRQRLTVAEWVRQALRAAARTAPRGDARKMLAVVRTASQFSFPTADIDRTLGEIERGYATDDIR
jgi:hypothetical protein